MCLVTGCGGGKTTASITAAEMLGGVILWVVGLAALQVQTADDCHARGVDGYAVNVGRDNATLYENLNRTVKRPGPASVVVVAPEAFESTAFNQCGHVGVPPPRLPHDRML